MIKLSLFLLLIGNVALAQTKAIDPDVVIRAYADSINRVTKKKDIPFFVMRECFVQDLPMLMSDIDVRNLIMNKISNPKAIKIILDTKDKRLKKPCQQQNKTMYDLLLARLKHLENNN
jgi:hypothetical protein